MIFLVFFFNKLGPPLYTVDNTILQRKFHKNNMKNCSIKEGFMNLLANMVIVELIQILKNRGDYMDKKIDHIGVAVTSLEKALPFYTEVLKLTLLGIEEVESEKVKIAFLQVGDSKIELLEPTSIDSPIAKFIEKRGEGIHHVAMGVKSIHESLNEIRQKGIRLIHNEPKIGAGGTYVAFMHPKSTNGVLFELCEKKG